MAIQVRSRKFSVVNIYETTLAKNVPSYPSSRPGSGPLLVANRREEIRRRSVNAPLIGLLAARTRTNDEARDTVENGSSQLPFRASVAPTLPASPAALRSGRSGADSALSQTLAVVYGKPVRETPWPEQNKKSSRKRNQIACAN